MSYDFDTRLRRPSISPALYPLITRLVFVAAVSAAFAIMWMAAN